MSDVKTLERRLDKNCLEMFRTVQVENLKIVTDPMKLI